MATDKSNTLKLAFIVLLTIGLILTLISLFTSSWRVYENANQMSFGLVTYDCNDDGRFAGANRVEVNDRICNQWWNARRDYERATMAFMFLALIAEIIALIAAFVLYKMRPRLYFIAPILAAIASLLLAVSFVLYWLKSDNNTLPVLPTTVGPLILTYHFGYSFWLALLAFLVTMVAAILGFMASKPREVDRYRPTATASGYSPTGVTVTTHTQERNTRFT
uniref:Uncharacterized protein n=1 Tax=Panagrolaimus sp. ES5 TaxID=591445 RepID=A0AC34FJ75_9BILA